MSHNPFNSRTRQQRAEELLQMLKTGPQGLEFEELTTRFGDSAPDIYRRWAESWIIPEVVSLIKELKDLS